MENFNIYSAKESTWSYFYQVLYSFIIFISSAPHETTACLDFWKAAPILLSQALLPGLQLHNQFLLKCKSLKCRSMERDIKDFIIFSQNSQQGLHPHPFQAIPPLAAFSINSHTKYNKCSSCFK